ncbi:hypothetical protein Tco_1320596 [Tanacetum coccineum]
MSGEEPVTQIAPVESPQMVSTVKLPILKKVTTDEKGVETEVPPKTAQELLARQRERKAKSIMLLAIPDEYQLSVSMPTKEAKTLWACYQKAILQGNVEHQEIKGTEIEMQGIGERTTPEETEAPSYIAQDEPTEFALTAYTSNSLGSDTELGLEYVEAQLVVHQKNEAVDEEKIAFLEFEVKDKSNVVTRLKNQLDKTLREKYDLKAKLEQFETSYKNLNKLINSQLSAKDKTGLGYGDQLNENDSSGSKLFNSVFNSRSNDGDDN